MYRSLDMRYFISTSGLWQPSLIYPLFVHRAFFGVLQYMLPDLENIGIAVEISLLSCMEAEIYVISYLLPVNGSHFYFSLIRTSDSLWSILVVSSYLENMGIAVGISFLSCIEAEICVISYLFPVNGSHL